MLLIIVVRLKIGLVPGSISLLFIRILDSTHMNGYQFKLDFFRMISFFG